MRLHPFAFAALSALLSSIPLLAAEQTLSDLLADPAVQLSRPADRAKVVARMAEIENTRRRNTNARAALLGLPVRTVRPGGRIEELVDFEGTRPRYLTTTNVNAAISTGANLLRPAPYSLTGAGVTIGLWDGGSARVSHQEFGGRVTVMDGAAAIDHATHVGGTLIASGVNPAARGMAGSATVDSYDWNSDTSEMTSRGATVAGEAGKIYLSNHSYNYIAGWNYVNGGSPYRLWEWYGSGTTSTSIETDFGVYNTYARDSDSLAFNAPYYLMFRSAGNERADNPSAGQAVAFSPGGASVTAYDPAAHPGGDGTYRGGFDTIGFNALAKNVMTVGSAADAVNGSGIRTPSLAAVSYFSSWGPTDDGRIKPDVIANGENLTSSINGGDASYGVYSGTSMATPNSVGSATLLIQQFGNLFPGQAMRSSTLKGLLIHTADDVGNPGPDYQNGWGLVNVKAAADIIQGYHDSPEKPSIIESQLTSTTVTRTHSFVWDGVSPIRATMCWVDPAGTATTTSESRTARLVNNLNVKIIAPGGSEYLPFVMPFVGTWTQASMSLPATTGINNTDNVEQVLIGTPPAAGTYQAVVSFSGTLTNANQRYSLVLSGTAPSGPLPPTVLSVTPDSAESGTVPVTISGSGFSAGASVKFTMAGQTDVNATITSTAATAIGGTLNTTGMASGLWNIVVTNPDSQTGSLNSAFAIIGTLWGRNFDPAAPGWSASANTGTSNWALVTTQSQSPTTSWFATGPATKNTDNLLSETINIPANTSRLKLSFWHKYNLETGNDGGVLEFSINNGAWVQVTNNGTAEAIISGGYPATLNNPNGNPNARNELAGKAAWTGNSGSSFTEVVVSLIDSAKYAGKSLRARWRLATNGSVASTGGWYVDTVKLNGAGGGANQAPSIVAAASATPSPVTALTADLDVTATDDGGEAGLTYTWSATGGTFERPVSLSENGSNAAKQTTATFTIAGSYSFLVTVRDAAGASTTSSVEVIVEPTGSAIVVSPAPAAMVYGGSQTFAGNVLDQFGDPLAVQPSLTWTTSGGGSVDPAGNFTAQTVGGPYTITATSGSLTGTAAVTINKAPGTVTLGALSQTYDGSPKSVTATTTPTGRNVDFTYNGSSTEPVNAGSYAIVATINDANYQGGTTGTLEISKASAAIDLIGLTQTYDGNQKTVTATTTPANLAHEIKYDGSLTAPSAVGTYAVTGTITDPNHTGSASGSLVIAPGNDWVSWQNTHFSESERTAGLASDNADPEADGLPNLAEYALGTDPHQFTPPFIATLDENGVSLVFTRPANLPGITYSAEFSDNFGAWAPVSLELLTPGTTETLRARAPLATEEPHRRFLRLRFERQ